MDGITPPLTMALLAGIFLAEVLCATVIHCFFRPDKGLDVHHCVLMGLPLLIFIGICSALHKSKRFKIFLACIYWTVIWLAISLAIFSLPQFIINLLAKKDTIPAAVCFLLSAFVIGLVAFFSKQLKKKQEKAGGSAPPSN